MVAVATSVGNAVKKTSSITGLDPKFGSGINQLIAASNGAIWIVSGFRSRERQTQLWNAALKKYGSAAAARKWVAPPGNSNHEGGFAVDLGGDLALAHKLAPQFGLYFPMGHEPWHVEPVGHRDSSPLAYTTPPDNIHSDVNYGSPQDRAKEAVLSGVFGPGVDAFNDLFDLGTEESTAGDSAGATTSGGASANGDWRSTLTPDETWLWTRESSLDPTADNPTSTAFGIWQGLAATRKQYLGKDWETTDPYKQIDAGRRYIKDRYGNAANAKAFWVRQGWY